MADLSGLLGAAGIGGAVGQAIVRLELDTSKYSAEMKAAEAQTVAGANAMGTSTSKFAGMAKTAFLGAGVAAVAFAAVSVKAAIEANEAHLKLQNTFANNAKLSDSSVAAFEAQADALRDLTGVDDEAIITAQALLGAFDMTGEQVQKLIPLIVDLSEKYGVDMEAAAKAVGKAVNGNTGSLARYGIVLDKAAVEADAFGAVLQGLGKNAGFAQERAKAEPWRVLGAQFEEVAEQVGKALLPVLRDLAEFATNDLVPVLKLAADNLDLLMVAAGAFTIWKIYPPIIGAVSFALDTFIVSALGAATAIGTVLKVLPLAGLGFGGYRENALGSEKATRELNFTLETGLENLGATKQKADLAAGGISNLTGYIKEGSKASTDFGNKLGHAMKQIRDSIVGEIPGIIGSITRVKDAFDITPKEFVAITHHWATIAHTIASDLREIARSDLSPSMRKAIADLPPEMRDAWVRGNATQRSKIEASIKATYKIEDQIPALARQALTGGQQVGHDMVTGIIQGAESGRGMLQSTMASIIRDAIDAARRAAKAQSPSQEMMKLGVDMMVGLADGINDAEQKAIDAAKAALDKMIESVTSALSKVQSKASSFRDAIKGGFSSFLDISGAFGLGTGGEISGFFQGQSAMASQLASVLTALKSRGASKGLLQQIASGGAEAIPFAQQLLQSPETLTAVEHSLQVISDLAQQTGKGLSEHFFGEKMDKLEAKLDRLHEDLRELNALEREGHSHDIVVDGQKLAETTRRELLKTGARNPDIFGGKA